MFEWSVYATGVSPKHCIRPCTTMKGCKAVEFGLMNCGVHSGLKGWIIHRLICWNQLKLVNAGVYDNYDGLRSQCSHFFRCLPLLHACTYVRVTDNAMSKQTRGGLSSAHKQPVSWSAGSGLREGWRSPQREFMRAVDQQLRIKLDAYPWHW